MRLPAVLLLAALLAACASTPEKTLRQRQTETLAALGFRQSVDEDWMLILSSSITFGFDDDKLREEVRPRIVELARQLRGVDIRRLRVEGHADNRGAAAYNQALSLRRAEAVARALTTNGFAESDIAREGMGAAYPAAGNDSTEGRATNRRVEIIVRADALAAQ